MSHLSSSLLCYLFSPSQFHTLAIHKEITKQFKHAIVWGASAKHARGQKVGLEHILEDEDVICIYKK